MAISIDTVYQKVLAIVNKEQRGYITPQEFNLFASQAQHEIFEQYFFDKNQYNRLPSNDTTHSDLVHMLDEKISIFSKREQRVRLINVFGDCILPSDVYKLDNISRFALTGVAASRKSTVEEVTEKDLVLMNRSPLAKPTAERPVYVRTGASTIKISPHSTTPSASAAWFFSSDVVTSNSSANITIPNNAANYSFLELGVYVYPETSSHLIPGTTITNISIGNTLTTLTLSTQTGSSFPSNWAASGYSMSFASDDIVCDYIRKPLDPKWTYTVVAKKALYNSSTAGGTKDFELHASEENNIIMKILQLAGITIKDTFITQAAGQKDAQTQQLQKQ